MGVVQIGKFLDWEHESYPTYEDFIVLPLFALFFPTIRFLLDRFVFEKVARRLIFGKGLEKIEHETDDRRKKIRKFKESAWKCIYFLSAEVFALLVTYDEPWLKETKYFWVGPGNQVWPDQKYKSKLKALYMYTGGFYAYSIFALIFWETRRSDFGVSMSHHVATAILIALSYIIRLAVLNLPRGIGTPKKNWAEVIRQEWPRFNQITEDITLDREHGGRRLGLRVRK